MSILDTLPGLSGDLMVTVAASGRGERAVPGFLQGKLGQPGLIFFQEAPHGDHTANGRNTDDNANRAGDF